MASIRHGTANKTRQAMPVGRHDCIGTQSARHACAFRSALTVNLLVSIGALVLCGCSRQAFPSGSMEPTIKRGETISINYAAYLSAAPKRWDVVAFEAPNFTNQVWVKRIVALPGETVSFATGGVTVNGAPLIPPPAVSNVLYVSVDYFGPGVNSTVQSPYVVPTNAYFLLGDCSTNSYDSRIWGAVHESKILGKVRGK